MNRVAQLADRDNIMERPNRHPFYSLIPLKEILSVGVNVLKIEGRGRSADYVYTVTKCYKEALQSLAENSFTQEKINQWMKDFFSLYFPHKNQ
jgi:collagenase-like PrtC family protease